MKENLFAFRISLVIASAFVLGACFEALAAGDAALAIRIGDIPSAHGPTMLMDESLSALLLLLVAIWLFFLSGEIKKGVFRARLQGLLIGISIMLFGAGFWYKFPEMMAPAVFWGLGFILTLSMLVPAKTKGSSPIKP